METTVAYRYITQVPGVQGGEPCIRGTRTPVRSIVQYWQLGQSADAIVEGLPHLTLAQVFEAMSYYYDHRDQIDSLIEKHRIPEHLLEATTKSLRSL